MNTIVPNLVVGVVAIAGGILIIRFRERIRNATVNGERAALGNKAGDALGKLQTAFWVVFAGAGAICIGGIMLTNGIVQLVHLLEP
jgi:hypothetical protein